MLNQSKASLVKPNLSYMLVIHLGDPTTDRPSLLDVDMPSDALWWCFTACFVCVENTEHGTVALMYQAEPQRS